MNSTPATTVPQIRPSRTVEIPQLGFDVFTPAEMAAIDGLDAGQRQGTDHDNFVRP